jgi:anti-sigma regulatory factor (Ser/Thr protein kinase)
MHEPTPFEGGRVTGAETEPMDRCPGPRGPVATAGPPPGTRRVRRPLRRADLAAVAEARALLRERLTAWGAPQLRDSAELLLSEVVTNALVHTGGGAVLTATLTRGGRCRLRVEVRDTSPHRPGAPRSAPDDDASGGRGLLIVRALADAWGVRGEEDGKTVWFELATPPPAAPASPPR